MTTERKARQTIDRMLKAAGWRVQNYTGHDTEAALGVAVREYPLKGDQRRIISSLSMELQWVL